ncbi:MAG: hypothetical protein OK457_00095 [Thaumarchaeota archaeon]|nr:hypothetical protein [Nitrososphaerota archaeon]
MMSLFLVSLFDFLYVLTSSWVAGREAAAGGIPLVYFTGAITTVSFFLYRLLDYRAKNENSGNIQGMFFSLFDLIAYFCVIALAAWGLIFPLLKPIPQNYQLYLFYQRGLTLNLYVVLIICASIIIFRVALQLLIVRPNVAAAKNLTPKMVPVVPLLAPTVVNAVDKKTAEMLETITKELSILRAQVNSLTRNAEYSYATRSAGTIRGSRNAAPAPSRAPGKAVQVQNPQRPSPPLPDSGSIVEPPKANVEKVPSIEPSVSNSVYEIPDAARDNPWAEILASRSQPTKPPQKAQTSASLPANRAITPASRKKLPAAESPKSPEKEETLP